MKALGKHTHTPVVIKPKHIFQITSLICSVRLISARCLKNISSLRYVIRTVGSCTYNNITTHTHTHCETHKPRRVCFSSPAATDCKHSHLCAGLRFHLHKQVTLISLNSASADAVRSNIYMAYYRHVMINST